MMSKLRSLFPLTWRQAVLTSAYSALFLTFLGLMISPTNFIHPIWILAYYLSLYAMIRALADDFETANNPALVMHMVLGPVQVLTGACIAISALLSGDLFVVFWEYASIAFGYFGVRNIFEAVYLRKVAAYEQEQVRKNLKRQIEQDAYYARETLERLERERLNQQFENSLYDDLVEFLGDSD